MSLYPVFMQPIAFQLEQRGFPIRSIQPNKAKPQFNVYYFEDTIEFHAALIEIIQRRKNHNKNKE